MNGFPPLPSSIPSCHDWISGVALTSTFAQTRRPYKASLSLGAAVSLRLPSHTPSRERSVQALAGSGLMQLPTIYGCLQLAPYGTCTRRHSSMPGALGRPTGSLRRPRFCISSSGHRDPPVRYSLKSLSNEIVGRGKQHLHRYFSEFVFRYNARGISDGERTELAVKGTAGKRLMLRDSKRIS